MTQFGVSKTKKGQEAGLKKVREYVHVEVLPVKMGINDEGWSVELALPRAMRIIFWNY